MRRAFLAAALSGISLSACTPLDNAARAHVVEYAQGLFNIPINSPLRIAEEKLDPRTCYTEVTLATSQPTDPFRRLLFLAPDRRFLTTAVYDTGQKAPSAAEPPACTPLEDAARPRLEEYARGLFELPEGSPLRISGATLDTKTCYYRLTFTTSPPAEPFRRTLFLSPDRRFLSTAVYDMDADAGQREATLNRGLVAFVRQRGWPAIGPADAPVQLILFGDYQCDVCARMGKILKDEILPVVKDKVHFAFLDFPLPGNEWARGAAELAACAARQGPGAYWAMHNYLLETQERIEAGSLYRDAGEFAGLIPGVDAAKFHQCAVNRQTEADVDASVALGEAYGVNQTPTLFLNGYKWVGAPENAADLIRVIERLAAGPAR